ncbi:MAG: hypothetical protein ABI471_02920 [Sphingomonas bacterium]
MTLNFLKGPTNQHLELSRMLWAVSVVAGIGFAGAHLVIDHAFSIIEFGTGMGLLMAGGGGAIAMKDTAVARAAVPQDPAP